MVSDEKKRREWKGDTPNDPTRIESNVKDETRMAPVFLQQPARRRIPHPGRAIVTRTDDPLRLLVVPQTPHQIRMSSESLHTLAGVCVPEFDGLVV
jgi:hypothetical protein